MHVDIVRGKTSGAGRVAPTAQTNPHSDEICHWTVVRAASLKAVMRREAGGFLC